MLRADGSIVAEQSKITVDLRDLRTDDALRDGYIKRNTLAVNQYPLAEFVPTHAGGLPNPLPEAGEYSFTLTGLMTIHGVQREITWDARARRDGPSLTGTATTSFPFGHFGMVPPRVPVVLSVVDEIRLQVDLVATQVA